MGLISAYLIYNTTEGCCEEVRIESVIKAIAISWICFCRCNISRGIYRTLDLVKTVSFLDRGIYSGQPEKFFPPPL